MPTRATWTGGQHLALKELPHHQSQVPQWFSGPQAASGESPAAGEDSIG